ncbi:hypothetical protein P4O66_003385 [Electrophorus voltai]|uniref:Uncharacterized protein n=1 Tax=Electrophorus voltai TaxID=2609070 RepID=A0AAD8YRP7_9TELE|nr:hypothetical protein P4O66_003385 [Electrophorus voltai]
MAVLPCLQAPSNPRATNFLFKVGYAQPLPSYGCRRFYNATEVQNADDVLITPLERFRKEQIGVAKLSMCTCRTDSYRYRLTRLDPFPFSYDSWEVTYRSQGSYLCTAKHVGAIAFCCLISDQQEQYTLHSSFLPKVRERQAHEPYTRGFGDTQMTQGGVQGGTRRLQKGGVQGGTRRLQKGGVQGGTRRLQKGGVQGGTRRLQKGGVQGGTRRLQKGGVQGGTRRLQKGGVQGGTRRLQKGGVQGGTRRLQKGGVQGGTRRLQKGGVQGGTRRLQKGGVQGGTRRLQKGGVQGGTRRLQKGGVQGGTRRLQKGGVQGGTRRLQKGGVQGGTRRLQKGGVQGGTRYLFQVAASPFRMFQGKQKRHILKVGYAASLLRVVRVARSP